MLLEAERSAARLVQRRLTTAADPLSLYVALAGGEPDTALFEGPQGPTLLMQAAAVRAECRGTLVVLESLTANGESLLHSLRVALAHRVVAEAPARLSLLFEPSRSLDSAERLFAPSPLDAIRTLLSCAGVPDGDPFAATALGVVAFDYAALCEDLADNAEDPLGFPDYVFWIAETLIVFEDSAQPRLLCAAFPDPDPKRARRNHHDAVARLARLAESCEKAPPLALPARAGPATPAEPDLDDEAFIAVVRRLKRSIAAGEVYQIVPSRTFRAPCANPIAAYCALRRVEPASYRFFVAGADFTLFGASPEASVRVWRDPGAGSTVEVRPIAGTRPRGASPDEDDRLETELRLDPKETAEHMMLVDLARNDVARISEPGTRRVARLMSVERYSRVMHLVSSVTGRLASGLDPLHALDSCLNAGTLTGAPKIRAMELLRFAERTRRGPYGGAVGWVSGSGAMDSAVVIRSALVRDGIAHVRAGAGIVHDSDPLAESDETRHKAAAVLSVLGQVPREAAE